MVFQLYDAWKPDGCQPLFLKKSKKAVLPCRAMAERVKFVFAQTPGLNECHCPIQHTDDGQQVDH